MRDAKDIEPPTTDDRLLWDAMLSSYRMPALVAADALAVFETLDEAPASASELAARAGLREEPLKALLPMLAASGFLVPRLGRYQLTAAARLYLRKDGLLYWGHVFLGQRDNPVTRTLIDRIKGTSDSAEGRPVEAWETGQLDADFALRIARFMNSHSLPASRGVARQGDFAGVTRLLDVGGGSACFSIALAERHPALRCTIMELPAMCDRAAQYVAEAGLSERIDTRAVDMFRQDWPTGYDAVLMANILHDWEPATNAKLAANAFALLPKGGRIYLHEMLLNDEGSGPLAPAAFGVMMVAGTRGRQYSFAELKALLEGAGFADVGAIDTYGYYSLVSARKP